MSLLTISPSPHVRSSMTTQKIMLLVVLALVPAIVHPDKLTVCSEKLLGCPSSESSKASKK